MEQKKQAGRAAVPTSAWVMLYLILMLASQMANLKVYELAAHVPASPQNAYITSKVLLCIGAALTAAFLVFTPMRLDLRSLRPSREALRRDLLCAGAVVALLVVAMVVARLIMNGRDPAVAARPAFGLYLGTHMRWIYPLSALLQELYIKAFVQHNVRRACHGSQVMTLAVTAAFFFALHCSYQLYYMVGAAVLCAATGLLYQRTDSVWGSVLIHFALGFLPRALGLKYLTRVAAGASAVAGAWVCGVSRG